MARTKKVEKIENFVDYINDKLEELNVSTEDNISNKLEVIKTGSLSLDISTGIGGIPKKKFTEIYGPESSGKTALALSLSNKAINDGNKVLYIDAENSLEIDRVKVCVENYSPEFLTIMQPFKMEDSLIIAEEGIKSKEFGLIILDSIGGLAPKKVLEDELTDANVALLARIMTLFVERNAYHIRDKNVAFVGINQVRDKIGSYLGGYETPGGHQWKHQCSLRIQLGRVDDIKMGNEKVGILTKFTIKKNKLAPPYRTYTFPIMFDRGVDSTRDIIEFAIMLGVLTKSGSFYNFEGNTLDIGINKTVEMLNQNKELLDKIEELCYTKINISDVDKTIEESEGNNE